MTSSKTDDGSVSVLVLAAGVATVLLLPLVGSVATALATQHRMATAADMAALAGALDVGTGDPCAAAQRVAQANGAELARCDVADPVVTVTVEPSTPLSGVPIHVAATARAAVE